jgi:hypothetical protein
VQKKKAKIAIIVSLTIRRLKIAVSVAIPKQQAKIRIRRRLLQVVRDQLAILNSCFLLTSQTGEWVGFYFFFL